ncbi:DUF3006 domain-containing protein [Bacillus sp. MUM 13]|uniref:DUF3006 domain-containing protein n=1 Tax=Bacillus sp. MUM 13 TaxID=1678001 RepID=UPI0008F564A0|nr:DUF3006 domain-containing protein [Bacillus sp. MUM 13]OIK08184.1 pyruvate kinase [Bacillus sp. MUM 13]
MKYIVDRIEGELAVCEKEDRSTEDIPLKELPAGVQAGDVVIMENGKAWIDKSGTKKRKAYIDSLANELFE